MPQLLGVAFGEFNNGDQAEEEEGTQHEERQARCRQSWRPLLSPTPCNLRTTQRHQESPTICPKVTPTGKCYKCKSTGHWAQDCQKDTPGPCRACKQTSHWKPDLTPSWRGSRAPAPEMAMLDDWGGPWILVAPPTARHLSPSRSPR